MTDDAASGVTGGQAIPFGEYAAIYDLIYRDKDYAGEAAFVSDLIERFAPKRDARIHVVDLACGTGRHVFELAKKGYAVEGSDISADMVGVARRGAAERGLDLRFHTFPFQQSNAIGAQFDVALAMFASLGYLTEFSDFASAVQNVTKLLSPGGIFIFDVWNGAAVLSGYSPHKIREVGDAQRKIERISRTTLDPVRESASVGFEFKVTNSDGTVRRFEEQHRVRFYFPQELSDLVTALGLDVVLICPFLEPWRALEADDWNMTLVARRR